MRASASTAAAVCWIRLSIIGPFERFPAVLDCGLVTAHQPINPEMWGKQESMQSPMEWFVVPLWLVLRYDFDISRVGTNNSATTRARQL